jgi:hypothetical protein
MHVLISPRRSNLRASCATTAARRLRKRASLPLVLLVGLLVSSAAVLSASAEEPTVLAAAHIAKTANSANPDALLTGRDVYKRVLDNRFHTFIQTSSLISADRSGHEQITKFRMWFENFRDKSEKNKQSKVLSKSMVRYLEPFDLRHTGYLVINNQHRSNDQYVYLNSSRQVRRVNLRGEAVFGSDFSFEDVIPKELEDSTYERLADGEVFGKPCFVVEATPKDYVESEYAHIRVYVEKERPIVLRTLYWDEREIQVKELHVDSQRVDLINDVYVPREMTMTNLKMNSYTKLVVSEIEPNKKFKRRQFDLTRLTGH